MTTPELDRRRLVKFLGRAENALASDIARMGMSAFELKVTWTLDAETREVTGTELQVPTATEDQLWLCILRCRTFILKSEDTYLPHVARAIYNLAPTRLRPKLQPLVDLVNSQVFDGQLASPVMFQGRLGMDNGAGEGRLLGSAQVTMDYIYGLVLHEDEDRRERLQNLRHKESVESAVMMQLAALLQLIRHVRDQIRAGQSNGWLPELDSAPTLVSSTENVPPATSSD